MRNSCWLLSSAGRRDALVEILRKTGGTNNTVVAVDASPLSAAGYRQILSRSLHSYQTPRSLMRYWNSLFNLALIAWLPLSIKRFSCMRSIERFLAEGIEVFASSSVVELAWDKWKFAKWLANNGFPGLKTVEAHDLEGLQILREEVGIKLRNGSPLVRDYFCEFCRGFTK